MSQIREPRWSSGAYASAPSLASSVDEDGRVTHTARAAVEAWAGSRQELLSIASALTTSSLLGGGRIVGRSIFLDGTSTEVQTVPELTALIDSTHTNRLLAFRLDLKGSDERSGATLLASPQDPGVQLNVWGDDPATVTGVAHLAFRRMMAGYVDRLGGWRAPAWMLASLAPLLLIGIAFPTDAAATSSLPRWFLIIVGVSSSVAVFVGTYSRLAVPSGFEILDYIPSSKWEAAMGLYQRVGSHKRVRQLLALGGALLVGVLGNKLSDLIPFP